MNRWAPLSTLLATAFTVLFQTVALASGGPMVAFYGPSSVAVATTWGDLGGHTLPAGWGTVQAVLTQGTQTGQLAYQFSCYAGASGTQAVQTTATGTWASVTDTWTPPAGCTSVTLDFRSLGTAGSMTAELDADTGATPTPTAAPPTSTPTSPPAATATSLPTSTTVPTATPWVYAAGMDDNGCVSPGATPSAWAAQDIQVFNAYRACTIEDAATRTVARIGFLVPLLLIATIGGFVLSKKG